MGKKKQHGGERAGAGRPAATPDEGLAITIAVSVPSGLVDRLDAHAKRNSLSRSMAVTRAIRGFLDAPKRNAKGS
jgi:hypothetical protein